MVLQEGASHSVDSSELAFRMAAMGAVRQAFPLAGPVVLEPIMSMEVVAPDEFQVRLLQLEPTVAQACSVSVCRV